MLTSTYTLVALQNEQAGVRAALAKFAEHVRTHYRDDATLSVQEIDDACSSMRALYRAATWRKVEMFLIPAVRKTTRQCDGLLAELGELTYQAYRLIDTFEARVRHGDMEGDVLRAIAAQLHDTAAAVCDALLTRLEREDRELLPLARTVIAGETWFAIANQSLMYDARLQERRHLGQQQDPSMQLQLI